MAAQLRRFSTSGSDKPAAPPARTPSSGAAEARVCAGATEARVCAGATEARICVGAIAAAHGIKGEVKIKTFTAEPLNIGAYGPVTDETGARSFRLSHVRAPGGAAGDSVVIARLDGVTDRNAAEALRGLRLYVLRDALPAAEAGEYYHHDLVGLAVVLRSGERLGTILAVHNFGAGDLLEVGRDGAESVMVPFTDAIVPIVDLAAGKAVIDPPEGLFDEGPVLKDDAKADDDAAAGKP